jgi:hypothetical protein
MKKMSEKPERVERYEKAERSTSAAIGLGLGAAMPILMPLGDDLYHAAKDWISGSDDPPPPQIERPPGYDHD